MKISFQLNKNKLIMGARLKVAYITHKRGYDEHIALIDADKDLSDLIWDEARAFAHGVVTSLNIAEAGSAEDSFMAYLQVPDDFDMLRIPHLQRELQRFLHCQIAGFWLLLTKPEACSELLAQAREALSAFMVAAAPRERAATFP